MIYRELSAGEFADLSSRILYEDNHLLIVNKKVGEIVQGDKTGDEPLSDKILLFINTAPFLFIPYGIVIITAKILRNL